MGDEIPDRGGNVAKAGTFYDSPPEVHTFIYIMNTMERLHLHLGQIQGSRWFTPRQVVNQASIPALRNSEKIGSCPAYLEAEG